MGISTLLFCTFAAAHGESHRVTPTLSHVSHHPFLPEGRLTSLSSTGKPQSRRLPVSIHWKQLGDDIDGEAANDNSGYSVTMSADGSRIGIGAYGNDGNGSNSGHVRVYDYDADSDAWVQVGNDIDGEAAYDYSGRSVTMSAYGNRIGIGAYGNDGNSTNSGHVRVFYSAFPPAHKGSFEVHKTGEITINPISANVIELELPYNASNRVHETEVLSSNCIDEFTESAADAFTVTNTPDSYLSDGFIRFNSKIAVDVSKINTTKWWRELPDDSNGGVFDMCIMTAVFLELTDANVMMNSIQTNLTVTVEMDTDFSITNINSIQRGVTKEEITQDYSAYLTAYPCGEDNSNSVTNEYSVGDSLKICVRSTDPSIVEVGSFKSLVLSQEGDSDGFVYIADSIITSTEIATTECSRNTSPNVCYADVLLLGRYFIDENPPDILATGSVDFIFPGESDNRRLGSVGNQLSNILDRIGATVAFGDKSVARNLQERLYENFFTVQISLKPQSQSVSVSQVNYVMSGILVATGVTILML